MFVNSSVVFHIVWIVSLCKWIVVDKEKTFIYNNKAWFPMKGGNINEKNISTKQT